MKVLLFLVTILSSFSFAESIESRIDSLEKRVTGLEENQSTATIIYKECWCKDGWVTTGNTWSPAALKVKLILSNGEGKEHTLKELPSPQDYDDCMPLIAKTPFCKNS